MSINDDMDIECAFLNKLNAGRRLPLTSGYVIWQWLLCSMDRRGGRVGGHKTTKTSRMDR